MDFSQYRLRLPSGQTVARPGVTPPPSPVSAPSTYAGVWQPAGGGSVQQAPTGLQPGYQQYATPPGIAPEQFAQHMAPQPPTGFIGQLLTGAQQFYKRGLALEESVTQQLPPALRPLVTPPKTPTTALEAVQQGLESQWQVQLGKVATNLLNLPYAKGVEPFVATAYQEYRAGEPFNLQYATDEQVDEFRATAPWWIQLGAGLLLDPLNLVTIGTSKVAKAAELSKLAREAAPEGARLLSKAQVAADMTREFAVTNSLLGRISPLRLTPAGVQNKLINEAVDNINILTFNSETPAQMLTAFIRNPDDELVRRLTAGYSTSTSAKRTAVLLEKVFTPTGATAPSYSLVIDLIRKAKGDPLESTNLLARKVKDAVAELVPLRQRSLLTKGRDVVNNYLSIGFMGVNPAYAIRNSANNLFTMLVHGIVPFGWTTSRRAEFLKAWGSVPAASKLGFGPGRAAQAEAVAVGPVTKLQTATRWRDLFAGAKARPLETFLIASQNAEVLSSETIVSDMLLKTWRQQWPKALRRLEPELRTLGLPGDAIELLMREVRPARNPQEVIAAIDRVVGGGDLAQRAPISIVEKLEDAVGEGPARVIADLVQKPGGVEIARTVVQRTGETAEAVQHVQAIALRANPKSETEMIALLQEINALRSKEIEAGQLATSEVARLVRAMTPEDRGIAWRAFKEANYAAIDELNTHIANLYETRFPDFGFTEPEAKLFIDHIDLNTQTWRQSEDLLAKAWEAKPNVDSEEFGRLLDQSNVARTALWNEYKAGNPLREQQEMEAIRVAMARQVQGPGAGAAPVKGQPSYMTPPRVVPLPPSVPPSRLAAMTSDELQAEIARLVNAAAGTKSEAKIAQYEQKITAALAEQQARLAKQQYMPPAVIGERPIAPSAPPRGWEPPAAPTPPEMPAPVPPAPPPVAPTAIADKQLRDMAEAAGIPVVTEKGTPEPHHLLNAIKRDTGIAVEKLEDLLPEQRQMAVDALRKRAAAKAALVAEVAPAVQELEQAAVQHVHPEILVADIMLAPERLQYKLDIGAGGAGRQFANVKEWNPALGRGVSLWVDPADGLTYAVNGHNRVMLAKRLQVRAIEAPYYIQAKTAAEARMVGALQNIAEGRGTPVDAAKLFRDNNMGLDLLERNGLALTENNVKTGLALANLNDTLFRAVVNKQLPIARAAIIGGKITDKDMQLQLIRELDRQLARGKKVTDDIVTELADAMVGGPAITFEQAGLFGAEAITQAASFEKAEFYAFARGQLTQEKRLFQFAAANADELARVGAIDRAAAQGISQDAAQLLELFDRVKNQRGPIASIADQAAAELAQGGNLNAIRQKYYSQLVEALPDAIAGVGARGIGNVGAPGAAQAGPGLFGEGTLGAARTHPFDPYAARANGARAALPLLDQLRGIPPTPVRALAPEMATAVRQFASDRIIPEMLREKAVVGQYAANKRNFILGDYGARHNVNDWLQWIMPYNFWYTFTYPNWGKRVLMNPALLSNYVRYRQILKDSNARHYREVTGDPNAVLPDYWDREIRLPWHGTEYAVNLERLINPLMALTEDFEDRTRAAAPGGSLVQALGGSGPTIWAPLVWGYSNWLWTNGYREAAQKWSGYLFPFSRTVKSITAAIKESHPEAPIPQGGIAPEEVVGLPTFTEGGDIWERKRIGYFLMRLWLDGKIDDTAFENASYSQQGPAWERAQQMEAMAKAPYNITSFLTGLGFRTRDKTDYDIQKMWDDWGTLMDAQGALDKEAKRRAFQAFDDRWPWAKEVMMSRAFDPWERLNDFAFLVLDRLPPGTPAYEARAAISNLDKWYDTGNKFAAWTAEEVQAFKAGLEQVAKQYNVPTPDMVTEFEAAKWAHDQRQSLIVAAMQAAGYPVSYEQYTQANRQYFAIPEADRANRQAFLAANPWLKIAWDANKAIKEQGLEGMSPESFNALMQKYYYSSGGQGGTTSDYAQKRAAAAKLFGADILTLADEYAALPQGDARTQWRQQHPDAYARLKQYWDFVYEPQTVTGGGGQPVYRGGGGGYTRGGGVSQVPPLPAPLATQPLPPGKGADVTGYALADYNTAVAAGRASDPAFEQLVQVLFGGNVFTLAAQYLALDVTGRDTWRQANPALWVMLERFLRWLMRQKLQSGQYRKALTSIPQGALMPPPLPP